MQCLLCSLQERDSQLNALHEELKQLEINKKADVSLANICLLIYYPSLCHFFTNI